MRRAKLRIVRLFNIQWDTDGEKVKLPKSDTFEVETDFDVAQDGADLLSDKHGWCVFGFDFEEVSK